METWQATIKESGNPNVLKPIWESCMFEHISDVALRDIKTREYLIEFWGLDKSDVEWYTLEKING